MDSPQDLLPEVHKENTEIQDSTNLQSDLDLISPSQSVLQQKLSEAISLLSSLNNFISSNLSDSSHENQFRPPFSSLDLSNAFSDHFVTKSLAPKSSTNYTRLTNYLTISADFLENSTLCINEEEVKNDKFDWRSRSLQVSESELVISGGSLNSDSVYLLNVVSKELKELPKLGEGRSLHAMTWVDFKPAVIGGLSDNEESLGSVEVLGKDSWEKVPNLVNKRYGHSACTYKTQTWVVGGASNKETGVLSLEYYLNGSWHEESVKIPSAIVGAVLFSTDTSLILLGGMQANGKNTDQVLEFDLIRKDFQEKSKLSEPYSSSQNAFRLDNNTLSLTSFKGKKITYSLV